MTIIYNDVLAFAWLKRHIWFQFQAQGVVGPCFFPIHFNDDDGWVVLDREFYCIEWGGQSGSDHVQCFLSNQDVVGRVCLHYKVLYHRNTMGLECSKGC